MFLEDSETIGLPSTKVVEQGFQIVGQRRFALDPLFSYRVDKGEFDGVKSLSGKLTKAIRPMRRRFSSVHRIAAKTAAKASVSLSVPKDRKTATISVSTLLTTAKTVVLAETLVKLDSSAPMVNVL